MITAIYTIGSRNIYLTPPGHFVIVCSTNRGDWQKLSQINGFCFKIPSTLYELSRTSKASSRVYQP